MLGKLASAFLDLLYPSTCAGCDEPIAAGAFCQGCENSILKLPGGCITCGKPGSVSACGACICDSPAFDSVMAGGLFGGALVDAIHRFKYGDRPDLGLKLGRWLAERVPIPENALVLPVPLGRARRISRGYDQARLLAFGLARASGREFSRGALKRSKETAPQVGKDRAARKRNMRGAFQSNAGVLGRDVVLVDDVFTTGATANEAAGALRLAGAAFITVVTLARGSE